MAISTTTRGVLSHFTGHLPAAKCDEPGREMTAKLVGKMVISIENIRK